MSKFRKKPVVIEAVQWTGGNELTVMEFCPYNRRFEYSNGRDRLIIETLEGDMEALSGDWIIKGVKGEFYPCKPDIFAATYEPADDEPPAPEGGRG